ncbi:MAG: nucleoside recognition domain-containing protein [Clostridia bacterium]|nr:nucleoside recognition domain-containing protein [Clostridia bacterium]
MLNYIWGIMIITSLICGLCNGKMQDISNALITGADDAVAMTISLMGIMCFWTGIMNIAENTGITAFIAKILKPLTKILFPKLKDQRATNAIIMNMTANMLGLSNAATPLGLKAMEELNKYSDGKTATDEMCMFIVINTASIQIIPSTIIALRQAAGSANPTDIIIPVWICSICVVTTGVLMAKIFSKRQKC